MTTLCQPCHSPLGCVRASLGRLWETPFGVVGRDEGRLWGRVEPPGEGKLVVADPVAAKAKASAAPDAAPPSCGPPCSPWRSSHRPGSRECTSPESFTPFSSSGSCAPGQREAANAAPPHQGHVEAIAAHLTKASGNGGSMVHFGTSRLRETSWSKRHNHHTDDRLPDGRI